MNDLKYSDGNKVYYNEPVWVEMSLMGDFWTHQKVPVYYYDMPTYKKSIPNAVP